MPNQKIAWFDHNLLRAGFNYRSTGPLKTHSKKTPVIVSDLGRSARHPGGGSCNLQNVRELSWVDRNLDVHMSRPVPEGIKRKSAPRQDLPYLIVIPESNAALGLRGNHLVFRL